MRARFMYITFINATKGVTMETKTFSLQTANNFIKGGGSAYHYLHLEVVKETEKAIQVKAIDQMGNTSKFTCWFPKKAIVANGVECDTKRLAPWFTRDAYTQKFINYNEIIIFNR